MKGNVVKLKCEVKKHYVPLPNWCVVGEGVTGGVGLKLS